MLSKARARTHTHQAHASPPLSLSLSFCLARVQASFLSEVSPATDSCARSIRFSRVTHRQFREILVLDVSAPADLS